MRDDSGCGLIVLLATCCDRHLGSSRNDINILQSHFSRTPSVLALHYTGFRFGHCYIRMHPSQGSLPCILLFIDVAAHVARLHTRFYFSFLPLMFSEYACKTENPRSRARTVQDEPKLGYLKLGRGARCDMFRSNVGSFSTNQIATLQHDTRIGYQSSSSSIASFKVIEQQEIFKGPPSTASGLLALNPLKE